MALPYIGLWRRISCKSKLKARRHDLRKCLARIARKRKKPGSRRAAGLLDVLRIRAASHLLWSAFRITGNVTHHSAQPLSPVKRMRRGPGHLGLIKPITCLDEIVGRDGIVRRIRNDAIPSDASRPRLDCPHQPDLKPANAAAGLRPARSSRYFEHASTYDAGRPSSNWGIAAASKNVSWCRSEGLGNIAIRRFGHTNSAHGIPIEEDKLVSS